MPLYASASQAHEVGCCIVFNNLYIILILHIVQNGCQFEYVWVVMMWVVMMWVVMTWVVMTRG